MKSTRKIQNVMMVLLGITVLVMSIGFATSAYTENLQINGSDVTISGAKWDVHFKEGENNYQETSGSVKANDYTLTGTTFTYDVTLTKPKDFYEVTIIVENAGTFDANLTSLTMTSLTEEQSKYLTYTVTYDNDEYKESNTNITGVLLEKNNQTASVKIRLEYIQPELETDLPEQEQTLSLTATLNFTQSPN